MMTPRPRAATCRMIFMGRLLVKKAAPSVPGAGFPSLRAVSRKETMNQCEVALRHAPLGIGARTRHQRGRAPLATSRVRSDTAAKWQHQKCHGRVPSAPEFRLLRLPRGGLAFTRWEGR